MTAAPATARSAPAVWLVVLGVALLVGAAAALLTGTFADSGGSSGTSYLPSTGVVVWTALILGGAFVGLLLYDRLRGGAAGVPTRIVVTILFVILILIVFAVLARGITNGGAPGGPPGAGSGPTNATQGTSNSTGAGNATATGSFDFFSIAIPYWVLYVALAGVLLAVGAVSARVLSRSRGAPANPDTLDDERRQVRDALAMAASALDDPLANSRAVLIGLYAQLLARLEPHVSDLAVSTPEEIRARHLVRLGIRPHRAEEITRLFERARYSFHPISPAEVRQARAALADATDDLDRRAGSAT